MDDPSPRRRRSNALAMQQKALVQLIVAGVFLFILVIGAAVFTVVPLGTHSPRAVAPVLGRFMRAGAEQDALLGHTQLSTAGLRTYRPQDVASLYAQRDLFDGFERVQVRDMKVLPQTNPAAPERAVIEAGAFYGSLPPARITATLDLEGDDWRISSIQITRQP